jgi:hypothetical protein
MSVASELREENAALREEIAELRERLGKVEAAQPKPKVDVSAAPMSIIGATPQQARQIVERGTTVRHLAESAAVVSLPSDAIMGRLLDIIGRRHPKIVGRESAFFDAFKAASLWMAHVDRMDDIAPFYLAHFGTRAESWLRDNGRPHCDASRAILAAAIGCGDVVYRLHDGARGAVAGIGLTEFAVRGRPPVPRWREIADGIGSLRLPLEPEPLRNYEQNYVGPNYSSRPERYLPGFAD